MCYSIIFIGNLLLLVCWVCILMCWLMMCCLLFVVMCVMLVLWVLCSCGGIMILVIEWFRVCFCVMLNMVVVVGLNLMMWLVMLVDIRVVIVWLKMEDLSVLVVLSLVILVESLVLWCLSLVRFRFMMMVVCGWLFCMFIGMRCLCM